MKKIKTVKIKNEDGSIGEESYFLSTDANIVNMENGYSVEDVIGDINVEQKGNIANQLNNLNNNVNSLNNDVDNLNSNIEKKVYYFNTVADMKNADLKNGDSVITLGYYEPNDGGGAEYRIVADVTSSYCENLNSRLYAKLTYNDKINLLMIGLKKDDLTFNNSTIFNEIIKSFFENTKLYIPNGEYYFKNSIILDKIDLEMEPNAKLILNSENIIDCFIKIRVTDKIGHYLGNRINGGIIDCNDKANTGIGINNSRFFDISTKVYNFNEVGLNTCYQAKTSTMLACAGTQVHNCFFYNKNEKLNTIAILDLGNDNQFDNIVVQDIVIGISLGPGSSVHSLHHWLSRINLFDTSTTIRISSGMNILQDIIVDTIATAIEYTQSYGRATVSGLLYYINTNVINITYLETHTPSVFKLNTLNSLYVSNSLFKFANGKFKLFDDTSYTTYNTTNFNTTQFVNIENSIYEQSTNLLNVLITPINQKRGFQSFIGNNNMPGLDRSTDFDSITETGIYGFNTYSGSGGNNIPLPTRNIVGILIVFGGKDYTIQLLIAYHYPRIITRGAFNGVWDNWHDYTGTYET